MTKPTYTRSTSYGKGLTKPPKTSTSKLGKLVSKNTQSGSGGGSGKPSSKRDSRLDLEQDDDDDDMSALPSFCTTCEKQIITPNASLLYCSEACRRKDGTRPASEVFDAAFPSPSPLAVDTNGTYGDIIPKHSPTMLRPSSIASDMSSLNERPLLERSDSEASRYLAQFLSATSISPSNNRKAMYRNQASSSHSTLPSLSNTPHSFASPSSSYSSIPRAAGGRPVNWNAQRHYSTRSIDLVMPVTAPASLHDGVGANSLKSEASTVTTLRAPEGEMTYEKLRADNTPRQANGSLRQLFAHEAMTSRPKISTPDELGAGDDRSSA